MKKELAKKVAKFKIDYCKLQICKLNDYDSCFSDDVISCDHCKYFVAEDDLIELAKEIIDEFVKGSVDVENL